MIDIDTPEARAKLARLPRGLRSAIDAIAAVAAFEPETAPDQRADVARILGIE